MTPAESRLPVRRTPSAASCPRLWHTNTDIPFVAAVSDAGAMNENANMVDTNRAAADAALAVWLKMWNTGSEIARRTCSEDFLRRWSGGHIRDRL